MKKSFILLFVLSLLVAMISGCNSNGGSEPENTEQVTIRYFTFSSGEAHEKDLQEMIRVFEEQNPNIHIEYELAAYDDYFTKLQTQIAGGNAADTFELNYENFVAYAAKGALLDLDSLIQNDPSFNPDSLNKQAFDAFKYDGKQYGMVESFSNVVLYYNKDLFDEKGVEYPQANWTWEDELEAAQELTDIEKGIWGTYSPIQFWEFYKTIAQNGGSIFNEDMTEATVNSKENIEALQWMVDKISKYRVSPSDEEMSGQKNEDLFKNGQIAMLRTGIWMFEDFKNVPFEWDIALEPGNTQKAHHFFSNGLAISNKTEHPEEAWEWIKFMSASDEAAQIRVDASWELPAVSNESLVDSYIQQSPPESREVIFEALDTLIVPPVIEEWSKMTDMFGKELDLVKLGEKTPEEALNFLDKELEKLIK